MHYEDFRKLYSPDSLLNHTDIGIINASFHSVNYVPDNVEQGGLRLGVDSLFEKIDNGNPAFLEHHVFVASSLKKYLKIEQGGSIVYHFNSDFFLENVALGKEIVQLTVNLGTSTNYTLIENGNIVNQEISVQYDNPGPKLFEFTASFADDTQLITKAGVGISIFTGQDFQNFVGDYTMDAKIDFQGYDEPRAYYGHLEYRVFYSGTQEKLMKPIIIIDGFDPGDKRKIEDKDSPKPANEHRSIEEVMRYFEDGNPVPVELIPILNGLGYDVVIVNHPYYWRSYQVGGPPEFPAPVFAFVKIDGGADYIERNAMAHIALYQELNNQLATNNSTEQLVIVGPSMGGQISRYALAYMEEQLALTGDAKWDHNTRLWVSVDSPHLGANVPIGVQFLLNYAYYWENSVAAGEFVVGMLQSAAARQQMIEQVKVVATPLPPSPLLPDVLYSFWTDYLDGRTISQGYSQDKGHPYFIDYYDELYNGNGLAGSRGYPQNLRSIAMVNGSLTNSNKFENPYGFMSYAYSSSPRDDQYANSSQQTFKVKGDAHFLGHIVTLETYFMPNTNVKNDVALFARKNSLFGGWEYHHLEVTNYNSRGSLDNAPGGWYPTQQELAVGILESSPCEWKFFFQVCVNHWNLHVLEQVSSFIPTASSLGFISPDFNWHEEFDRDLVCMGEIPFDNYYGPKINEQHTSFTEESFEWFKKELDGDNNFPEPTVYLDETNISGPSLVCYGQQSAFGLIACTAPVDSWSVSNNLNIVSSNAQAIWVEPINSSVNGEGYVIAHFAHDTAKKTFLVGPEGPPSIQTIPAGITQKNTGTSTIFDAVLIDPGLQYVWRLHYNGQTAGPGEVLPKFSPAYQTTIYNNYEEYIASYPSHQVSINWGNVPGIYSMTCRILNECGESAMDHINVTVTEPSGDPCNYVNMAVSPNPVPYSQINVEMIYPPDDSGPCPFGTAYYDNGNPASNLVEIYNLQGNVEYSNTFHEYDFTIIEPGLPSGDYILTITSANGKRGQEIIIVE